MFLYFVSHVMFFFFSSQCVCIIILLVFCVGLDEFLSSLKRLTHSFVGVDIRVERWMMFIFLFLMLLLYYPYFNYSFFLFFSFFGVHFYSFPFLVSRHANH